MVYWLMGNLLTADVWIPHHFGSPWAVDVTVVDPTNTSLSLNTYSASKLLQDEADRKDKKYKAECTARGIDFHPFVVSHLGSFHDKAIAIMKTFAMVHSKATGRPFSDSVLHLRHKISLSLARTQAAAIIRRGSQGHNILVSRFVKDESVFAGEGEGVLNLYT